MDSLRDRVYERAERACIPLAVHFDLTYRCNLRCIHCYIPESDRYPSLNHRTRDTVSLERQGRTELTTEEIFDVLDQLAECGTLLLNFSGGEIFLRRDIMDIVEYARGKRFSVSLMTTGTVRFDEKAANRLADMGIQAVDISLYSDEAEVHDSVTRTLGSFCKTIKAVELFRERGIRVKLKCPLMKANIESFRGVKALAEFYGADWMFDPSLTVGKDGDRSPTYLRISDDELREYYAFAASRVAECEEKEGARVAECEERAYVSGSSHSATQEHGPNRSKHTGGPSRERAYVSGSSHSATREEISAPICESFLNENPCGASHASCYISPYGDVQPCIEITMICGNLREKPFREIWETSEGMLMVRAIRRKDLRKCWDCPEPYYCHRCIGQAYAEHGDLLAPSEESCRNTKILHEMDEVDRNGQAEEGIYEACLRSR